MVTLKPNIASSACFRRYKPGLSPTGEAGKHQSDFWFLFHNGMLGKKGTDECRASFAIDLIDKFVTKILTVPESKAAIVAAKSFSRAAIDEEALFEARKLALQAFTRLVDQEDCLASKTVAAHAAFLATMAGDHVRSIIEEIENIVMWQAHEKGPSPPSNEQLVQMTEDFFQNATKCLFRHVPAELKANWQEAMKKVYHFDDPRFQIRRWVPLDRLHIPVTDEVKQSKRFQLVLKALDAFEACQHVPEITPELLQPFVEILCDDIPSVRTVVLTMVIPLAWHFEVARQILLDFLVDRRGQVRFEVISSCKFYGLSKYPRPFVVAFLTTAVNDRSAKNRHFAAEAAGRYRCVEVLPRLEELATQEKSEKIRGYMKNDAALLRDGFYISPGPNRGQVSASFYTNGHFTGLSMDCDEYAKLSFEEVQRRVEAEREKLNETGW